MPTQTDRLRNMLHRWRETVGAQMPAPDPEYDRELGDAQGRFRKPAAPHGAGP